MTTPDRIRKSAWINSHLSVARHFGGIKINGEFYVVENNTGDLVKQVPKVRKRRINQQKP